MEMPEPLTASQQLSFVIGEIVRRAAEVEDATSRVLSALNEDFELAAGHPRAPNVSRVSDECRGRFQTDTRLRTIGVDAIDLLGRVRSTLEARNEIVHALWVLSALDGAPSTFRTLREQDGPFKPGDNSRAQPARSIEDLMVIADEFRVHQRSMNFLWYSVIAELSNYATITPARDSLRDAHYAAIVRGEFSLVGEEIRLDDRDLAKRLGS